MMSSTIKFRDATTADYDDVVNINDNIYNGLDYLPSYYHDFCKDPQCHMFVAEDDGKVVAFVMRSVIDGGRTNVSQAGRIRKEYMGRGIVMSLGNYAHREIIKRCPTIQRTVYTAATRAGIESAMKKIPYLKLLEVKPEFSCDIALQSLPAILKSTQFHSLALAGPYPQCRRQSEDEALASLVHEVPFPQFVPSGMWVVNWIPMGHHVGSYQKVVRESSFFVSRITEDSPVQAVSFLTPVRVPAGWACWADFYCPNIEKNPFVLVAHMLRHLEEMSSLTGAQHISYSVFYPESYPGNLSKNLFFTQLADLKQKRVDDNLLLLSMNVADIEKRLNHQSRL